jgi:hypothetical protein
VKRWSSSSTPSKSSAVVGDVVDDVTQNVRLLEAGFVGSAPAGALPRSIESERR